MRIEDYIWFEARFVLGGLSSDLTCLVAFELKRGTKEDQERYQLRHADNERSRTCNEYNAERPDQPECLGLARQLIKLPTDDKFPIINLSFESEV